MWVGSTDHGDANGVCFRGYSSAPDVAPDAWEQFALPGGFTEPETPWLVHDPTEARPFRLYYHCKQAETGIGQRTRLASYATDWTGGTDEGEVLPETGAGFSHTGYAHVYRRGADDWVAWSLTVGGDDPRFGYWTSTDGETWTCINGDLDVTSMVASGLIAVTTLSVFTVSGTRYGIAMHKPEAGAGGASVAGVKVVLVEMPDEETFTNVQTVWDPIEQGVEDWVSSVQAFQDPGDETLIHLYVTIAKTSVYHHELTLP